MLINPNTPGSLTEIETKFQEDLIKRWMILQVSASCKKFTFISHIINKEILYDEELKEHFSWIDSTFNVVIDGENSLNNRLATRLYRPNYPDRYITNFIC